MRKAIAVAFLAFLVFTAVSHFAFADDDEAKDDNEREGNENENRMPGFEVALAIACSFVATKLHRRAS